ncbi:MAG: helix-turn-helix domain-containing protein [Actinomycetes bacterium]
MRTKDRLARVEASVERACAEASTVVQLCRTVQAAVADVVPADRWCGFAVDPSTMFSTNGYHDEGVDLVALPRLLELEHGADDVNHLPALARTPTGVATLSAATAGDLATSARWRDVLAPSGLVHELRAVFRTGHTVWGALVLMRGPDVADFDDTEAAFVSRVAPTIAHGFRRVLVRQHVDYGGDAREAGIVLVGGDPPAIRTSTPAATFWLDQIDDSGSLRALPTALVTAVQAARRDPGATPAVRARARNGRWVTITAQVTGGTTADMTAEVGVVVQPSRPAEIAQIVGAAYGLTPREREVVRLVASGHSNDEIARALFISRYTVADHLKSVFAKVGVATRGELTSRLFYDYYLPRSASDQPAGTDGFFIPA